MKKTIRGFRMSSRFLPVRTFILAVCWTVVIGGVLGTARPARSVEVVEVSLELREGGDNYDDPCFWQDPTDPVAAAARLPRLIGGYRVHAGLLMAFAAAGLSYGLLFRTVLGYEMRAAGLNRVAAHLAGLHITRALIGAMAISGALAGLAGGIEVSALTFRLYDQFSPGYGFTAIAVALLGRLHPAGIVVAAVFFAALDTGSTAMQSRAGVSSVLVSVIQATVIFSLIAVDQSRWRLIARGNQPAEAGVPPPAPAQTA